MDWVYTPGTFSTFVEFECFSNYRRKLTFSCIQAEKNKGTNKLATAGWCPENKLNALGYLETKSRHAKKHFHSLTFHGRRPAADQFAKLWISEWASDFGTVNISGSPHEMAVTHKGRLVLNVFVYVCRRVFMCTSSAHFKVWACMAVRRRELYCSSSQY